MSDIINETFMHVDGFLREKLNCPFYPACYIMGDCGFNDWKEGNCGLPKEEAQKRREKWMADLKLRNARFELGQKLSKYASQGKLDDLIGKLK